MTQRRTKKGATISQRKKDTSTTATTALTNRQSSPIANCTRAAVKRAALPPSAAMPDRDDGRATGAGKKARKASRESAGGGETATPSASNTSTTTKHSSASKKSKSRSRGHAVHDGDAPEKKKEEKKEVVTKVVRARKQLDLPPTATAQLKDELRTLQEAMVVSINDDSGACAIERFRCDCRPWISSALSVLCPNQLRRHANARTVDKEAVGVLATAKTSDVTKAHSMARCDSRVLDAVVVQTEGIPNEWTVHYEFKSIQEARACVFSGIVCDGEMVSLQFPPFPNETYVPIRDVCIMISGFSVGIPATIKRVLLDLFDCDEVLLKPDGSIEATFMTEQAANRAGLFLHCFSILGSLLAVNPVIYPKRR